MTVEVTRPRGRPASRCCVGAFQKFPKGLKRMERREAGRGAGVHAPQAEFTFRTLASRKLPGRFRVPHSSLTTPALSILFELTPQSVFTGRVLWPSVDNHGSLVTHRSVSARPLHLFDPKLQTMITTSNSLLRGSGMPIHVDGVSISRHVRYRAVPRSNRIDPLGICPTVSPHPVQPHRKPSGHGHRGDILLPAQRPPARSAAVSCLAW